MSHKSIKFKKPDKYNPYPETNDKEFQKKISVKKEFHYTYDSSEKSCDSSLFMLQPHQEFVKRYISPHTHYNGLLMFHGLGSGKTCSAIGICEETRKILKYNKQFKKIMIVASPNVQKNFQLQLFNEHKLKKIKQQWVMEGCLGSSLLEEIGVYNNLDITKEEIIKKIKKLIKKYYSFVGYIELSNIIDKKIHGNITKNRSNLRDMFENRLIVIDEIHNIRTTNDEAKTENQKVAQNLELLVKHVKHMKLLFLTGTPIFNKPEEIVFILNILNQNDRKPKMKKTLIFDKNGDLKKEGKQHLIALSNGYISYVRGENPYIFPHLTTPKMFDHEHSIQHMEYPRHQFNEKPIIVPLQYIDLFVTPFEVDHVQQEFYLQEIEKLKKSIPKFDDIEHINYHKLLSPLQSLNIIYPKGDDYLLGTRGLEYTMDYEYSSSPRLKHSFTYKENENMFDYENIGKYSIKIKTILDHVQKAEGIILIYSQWIDSGLLPMALALESIGYKRYGSKTENLIDNRKTKYSYSIICGDKELSPDNDEEVEGLTNKNEHGQRVKIVLISQTGTEGIDLNHIRQVHIMEPWYNMNRIEQIIGRARRNCSHKKLDKEKQNVQVFLYSTKLSDNYNNEALDMYLYRIAESKSISIGKVNRILKQNAIDCLLNDSQQDFSTLDKTENIVLSDGTKIKDFPIKDQLFSNICDYQEQCDYTCTYDSFDKKELNSDTSTYHYDHLYNSFVIDYLRRLFQTKYVYSLNDIYKLFKINKNITKRQIQYGIEYLMKENVFDQYGEKGYIIKVSDLLLFQPHSSDYEYMPLHERQLHMKRKKSFDMEEITTLKTTMTIVEFNKDYDDKLDDIINDELFELFEFNELYEAKPELIEHSVIEYLFERLYIKDKVDLLNDIQEKKSDLISLYEPYKYDEKNIILVNENDELELYKLMNDKWLKQNYIDDTIKTFFRSKKIVNKGKIMGYVNKKGSGQLKSFELKIIHKENKNILEYFKLFTEEIKSEFDMKEINKYHKQRNDDFILYFELILRITNQGEKRYFLNPLETLIYNNKIDSKK
jgi:hypothetical protein